MGSGKVPDSSSMNRDVAISNIAFVFWAGALESRGVVEAFRLRVRPCHGPSAAATGTAASAGWGLQLLVEGVRPGWRRRAAAPRWRGVHHRGAGLGGQASV